MKRNEGEDFEAYRQRRKVANIIQKIKQIPRVVWNSYARGQFVRGRDQLVNSRADANREEAIARKLQRKIDHEARLQDM